jgi:hypothetical protein
MEEKYQLQSRATLRMLNETKSGRRGICLEGMTRSKVRIINGKNGLELPLHENIEDERGGKSSYKYAMKFYYT